MGTGETDRTGLDDATNHLTAVLGRFVPQWVARRAIAVTISTDRNRYAPGDPVEISIEFFNRLPIPVQIHTPRQRLWGWSVDGHLEGSDERRYLSRTSATLEFRGRERKRVHKTWNGMIHRSGDLDRWEPLEAGTHEITAFVAVEGVPRPTDTVTIEVG
ncbi:MAG: hypothetical protein ACOCSF_02750 [Halanaeroarchaeum sp.]